VLHQHAINIIIMMMIIIIITSIIIALVQMTKLHSAKTTD